MGPLPPLHVALMHPVLLHFLQLEEEAIEQLENLKYCQKQLAIEQQARVGFPEPLHITGEIPVVLEIPVSIPLQPTPVGTYLRKMAGQLDSLLAW